MEKINSGTRDFKKAKPQSYYNNKKSFITS